METLGAQAGFEGFAPSVPTDRLFFALFPGDETASHIAALAASEGKRHGMHGKPLRNDRLHVTLFHLGDWAGVPEDVVAAASRAADALRAAAFDLAFDTVASFATRRAQKPFVLKAASGNEALRAFHADLAGELRQAGLAQWARGNFEPHVTLAYDRQLVPPQPVEPVAWRAREFVLVHSLLGQTRHVRLANWRLVE
jgi:2'-5' RNA ligase